MDNEEHIYHEKDIKDDYESFFEGSTGSSLSSCSSDSMEDVTSSSSNGPLYELSDLMAQLPIKRGLSKYYQGKSQTFTSLSNVKSLDDLVKTGRPNKKTLVSCKSYGGGLDHHIFSPKAVISKKKDSRRSYFSTSKTNRSEKVFTSSGIS